MAVATLVGWVADTKEDYASASDPLALATRNAAEAQLKLRTGVFMTWMAKASQDVDEYRQALLDQMQNGEATGHAWSCSDGLDGMECSKDHEVGEECKDCTPGCNIARTTLARDALRVEQPKYPAHYAANLRKQSKERVAEPEREGAE